ncbi:phosphatidylinositol 4-phosphate 5-kinase-like [Crassostrea angulata]|uniref:phosphatidylinositol 4-phosphate 5-kinase-like n=1 Tax=Magallana angulata TaxID=2784310 RepID=UPI0022B13BBE|nr:phosphatidylinositol 4-phosphate 5-kinase-like [Crassostrea angulata]
MMNSVILILLACLVLEKTLANPDAYNGYGGNGNGNENNGDGDVDNGDNGNTSSSDDSDDSDDKEENKEKGNNEVCKNTIRATCDRFADGDFYECIECFEYFDDKTQCIQANERRCIWDDDRRVCIFDLEIDT